MPPGHRPRHGFQKPCRQTVALPAIYRTSAHASPQSPKFGSMAGYTIRSARSVAGRRYAVPAGARRSQMAGCRAANAVDRIGTKSATGSWQQATRRARCSSTCNQTTMMFERFTEKAIKVVMLAQEESRRLGHNFVGTEQILLGLIGESTGISAKVLKSMGVTLKEARTEVEKVIGRGSGFVAVEIPFTPRAKRVLELSLDEARQLGAPRAAPSDVRRKHSESSTSSTPRAACRSQLHRHGAHSPRSAS
jgi:Clp amino terminal domain, pathogenicity island component